MHAMQEKAEDLRAELDAVRAQMDRAAEQAEAARQENAKNLCRIQAAGEAQGSIRFHVPSTRTYDEARAMHSGLSLVRVHSRRHLAL